ncbi:unnamed protein product [Closterium sp. Naga37s-1]|nr:unnamed protein product [Closterium sp. Naga37s-1]
MERLHQPTAHELRQQREEAERREKAREEMLERQRNEEQRKQELVTRAATIIATAGMPGAREFRAEQLRREEERRAEELRQQERRQKEEEERRHREERRQQLKTRAATIVANAPSWEQALQQQLRQQNHAATVSLLDPDIDGILCVKATETETETSPVLLPRRRPLTLQIDDASDSNVVTVASPATGSARTPRQGAERSPRLTPLATAAFASSQSVLAGSISRAATRSFGSSSAPPPSAAFLPPKSPPAPIWGAGAVSARESQEVNRPDGSRPEAIKSPKGAQQLSSLSGGCSARSLHGQQRQSFHGQQGEPLGQKNGHVKKSVSFPDIGCLHPPGCLGKAADRGTSTTCNSSEIHGGNTIASSGSSRSPRALRGVSAIERSTRRGDSMDLSDGHSVVKEDDWGRAGMDRRERRRGGSDGCEPSFADDWAGTVARTLVSSTVVASGWEREISLADMPLESAPPVPVASPRPPLAAAAPADAPGTQIDLHDSPSSSSPPFPLPLSPSPHSLPRHPFSPHSPSQDAGRHYGTSPTPPAFQGASRKKDSRPPLSPTCIPPHASPTGPASKARHAYPRSKSSAEAEGSSPEGKSPEPEYSPGWDGVGEAAANAAGSGRWEARREARLGTNSATDAGAAGSAPGTREEADAETDERGQWEEAELHIQTRFFKASRSRLFSLAAKGLSSFSKLLAAAGAAAGAAAAGMGVGVVGVNVLGGEFGELEERYELEGGKELGAGQFGVTRVVVCRSTGRRLACKTINKAAFKVCVVSAPSVFSSSRLLVSSSVHLLLSPLSASCFLLPLSPSPMLYPFPCSAPSHALASTPPHPSASPTSKPAAISATPSHSLSLSMLSPSFLPQPLNNQCKSDVENVRREVAILNLLKSQPNVIHLEEAIETPHAIHLIMELCSGGELFERIKERRRYSEREAALVMRAVLGVLQSCHQRHHVVHRDIKPENILLAHPSSHTDVRIIDFGVATFLKPGGKMLNDAVGSLFYIAPEVIGGSYGTPADVWSAGVVLYVLLAGVPPFWAETEAGVARAIKEAEVGFQGSAWRGVSEEGKDLILRMLDRDQKRRVSAQEALGGFWSHRPFFGPLANCHVETIFAAVARSLPAVRFRRECLRMADGGTVALDWPIGGEALEGTSANGEVPPGTPWLILLPGLTGGSGDTYVRHMLVRARRAGWGTVVFNSRGCANSPVTSPQFYSASFTEDLRQVVRHVAALQPLSRLYAAGWSLGANILVRYLGQEGEEVPLAGAISLCNPFDLLLADRNFHIGFNNFYDQRLGSTLRGIYANHAPLFEGLGGEYDIELVARAKTVRDFDVGLTRVSFGYPTVDAYYSDASSSRSIKDVRLPLLCVQALYDPIAPADGIPYEAIEAMDDPIAPAEGIPYEAVEQNPVTMLVGTSHGGHLGWVASPEAPFGAPWPDILTMASLLIHSLIPLALQKNPLTMLVGTSHGGHLGWVAGSEAPFGAPWPDILTMEFLEGLEKRAVEDESEGIPQETAYEKLFGQREELEVVGEGSAGGEGGRGPDVGGEGGIKVSW